MSTALNSSVESQDIIQRCQVSIAALLIYELLITSGREVNTIWRSRPKWLALLYILNRYPEILNAISNIVSFFPLHDQTCRSVVTLFEVTLVLPYISWIAFSSIRAYALSGRNAGIGSLVLILSTGFVVVTIYPWAITDIGPSCEFILPHNRTLNIADIIARIGSLLAESMIIALTLRKSMATLQAPLALSKSLMGILLRNSIMCFLIPFILNAVVLAAYVNAPDTTTTSALVLQLIRAFRDPITSILVSRFLLELCELSSDTAANGTKPGHIMTSDITVYPSDVLSDLPEDQWTVRQYV